MKRAEHPLEKVVRSREDAAEPDVEKAKQLGYDILGDPDASEELKQKIRDLLIALGADVEEIEKGAKAIARHFRDPVEDARRVAAAQARAMGGRR